MPATAPPPVERLIGFPARRLDTESGALFRLFTYHDPTTGSVREPWWFSSRPTGSQRFDLARPNGTCYLSDRRYGAWLETFRGTGLVARQDLARRRLLVATRSGPAVRLADLDAAGARAYGVTAQIGAGGDYELSQQWADALHGAAFAGVSSAARHDPTHTACTIALFGPAGARRRIDGWRTRRVEVSADASLLRELARFGTGIAAVPYDVATVPPL
ncbi:MAG: RES family NAD+ phosphorylase [Mycobacteriales bacterium]